MSIERVRGPPGQRKLPRERPRSVRCMRHLENCWNVSGGPEGAAQSEAGAQGRSQIDLQFPPSSKIPSFIVL